VCISHNISSSYDSSSQIDSVEGGLTCESGRGDDGGEQDSDSKDSGCAEFGMWKKDARCWA
jgi:hypothetical protein